jgi:hypothetical protein
MNTKENDSPLDMFFEISGILVDAWEKEFANKF